MTPHRHTESFLKGRMTETLVEEMLKQSGNAVHRFGYDMLAQNTDVLDASFDAHPEVGERVRSIPDFVVIDKKGVPALVEVKFRRDPIQPLHEETIERLETVEKYWNAQMIFVNCSEKPYFRVCKPPYFKTFSQPERGLVFEPLQSIKEWGIPPELYEKHEALVEKYLKPVSSV